MPPKTDNSKKAGTASSRWGIGLGPATTTNLDDDQQSGIYDEEEVSRGAVLQILVDEIKDRAGDETRAKGGLEDDCNAILESDYRHMLSKADNDWIYSMSVTEKVARMKASRNASTLSMSTSSSTTNTAPDMRAIEHLTSSISTGPIESLVMPRKIGEPIKWEDVERWASNIRKKFANSSATGEYERHIDKEALAWIKDIFLHNKTKIMATYDLSAAQIEEPTSLTIEDFRKIMSDILKGDDMVVDLKLIFLEFSAQIDPRMKNGYSQFSAYWSSFEKYSLKGLFSDLDDDTSSYKLDASARALIIRHQILKNRKLWKDANNETSKYLLAKWMTMDFPTFRAFKDAVSNHFAELEAHFATEEKLGGPISMCSQSAPVYKKGQSKSEKQSLGNMYSGNGTCHACGNKGCWYRSCPNKEHPDANKDEMVGKLENGWHDTETGKIYASLGQFGIDKGWRLNFKRDQLVRREGNHYNKKKNKKSKRRKGGYESHSNAKSEHDRERGRDRGYEKKNSSYERTNSDNYVRGRSRDRQQRPQSPYRDKSHGRDSEASRSRSRSRSASRDRGKRHHRRDRDSESSKSRSVSRERSRSRDRKENSVEKSRYDND